MRDVRLAVGRACSWIPSPSSPQSATSGERVGRTLHPGDVGCLRSPSGFRQVAVDVRSGQMRAPVGAATPPVGWAVAERRDATRVTAWGPVGAAETAAIARHMASLPPGRRPLVVDLTGVTELHADAVAWLGARHVADGPDRPLLVEVLADGHLHQLLTAPGAPRLRLMLQ